MVTTFNKKDLISFGKYLLSEERIQLITDHHQEGSSIPLQEKLEGVHDADLANWMESKGYNEKPNRKVKVGDIVHYHPSGDQDYDKYASNNGAEFIPAIVTVVWSEDCVNLTAFPDAPGGKCPPAFSLTSVCKLPDGTHNPQTGMWSFR